MGSDLPLLLEPETLHLQLSRPDLLVVDLSAPRIYEQAHIPGSVHLPHTRLQAGTPPAPGALPTLDALEQLFAELALTPDTHVVALDDEGGGWASRLLWVLESIGHTRYSLLNGGIHAWLADGLPTTDQITVRTTGDFELAEINPHTDITLDALLQQLGSETLAIWDARSAEEYNGLRAYAQKPGHIPGAVHYEWTAVMDRQRQLRLRPLSDIAAELAALGIDQSKQVIVHCQTHHRSSLSWLVAKLLGLEVRAYSGSWYEWGNTEHTPVVNPSQPD